MNGKTALRRCIIPGLKMEYVQYFGHLIWRADSGKDPNAGKDWRQEKRATEDGMVRRHHWFNGHELGQTCRRWWGTGRPGMLHSMGSWRVGHNLVTEQQQKRSTCECLQLTLLIPVLSFLSYQMKGSSNSSSAFFTGVTSNRVRYSAQVSIGEGHCQQREQLRTTLEEGSVLPTLWPSDEKSKDHGLQIHGLFGGEGANPVQLWRWGLRGQTIYGGRLQLKLRKAVPTQAVPTGAVRTESSEYSGRSWVAVREIEG